MPIEIVFRMDRQARFSANLAVLYKPWKHVAMLVGVLWAVFFALFGVDYAINGAEASTAAMWQMMTSLLYLAVVMTGAAAFYFAYAPLQAYWSAAAKCRKDGAAGAPQAVRFEQKRVTAVGADGAETFYEWTDLKPWRQTRAFWILRDRTKKGQLIVPRAGFDGDPAHGITDEQIAAVLACRDARICRTDPVAAERARQKARRTGAAAADSPRQAKESDESQKTLQDDDLAGDGR